MNLGPLGRWWDGFFFRPVPAYPLGLFRIAFAAVVLLDLVLLLPDAQTWLGDKGTLPVEDVARTTDGVRINVLTWLPRSDFVVDGFLGFSLLVTLAVLAGFHTRLATFLLWVCLASLHHRNVFVLNSGDTLMRNLAFLLMFAPVGAAVSVDRWLGIRRGALQAGTPLIVPWAQRLMQLQVCVMYLSTVIWKLKGTAWLGGSAVFIIMQLDDFQRFPVPSFMHALWFSRIATWFTLIAEGGVPTLVWFRRLRYPVLLAGAALHLGLEYTMNVPVFQWVVLSSYCLFVDPDDLARLFGVLNLRRNQANPKATEARPAKRRAA
jgi:hypothetical protein